MSEQENTADKRLMSLSWMSQAVVAYVSSAATKHRQTVGKLLKVKDNTPLQNHTRDR